MSLYEKGTLRHLAKLNEWVPEQAQSFDQFNSAVFAEGALSKKEKEIIAVGVAYATKCPYCLDIHTKKAKEAGASLQELAEAGFVAAALEAGGVMTHSTHMQAALEEEQEDVLYKKSNLKRLGNLNKWAGKGFKAYQQFSASALKDGELPAQLKELIAVAVAHITECPYCIDVHSKNAKKAGATKEQLSEAILVASAVAAGGAYTHIANMIESYGSEE
jgi:AhpD family alkylhydroperoxidase